MVPFPLFVGMRNACQSDDFIALLRGVPLRSRRRRRRSVGDTGLAASASRPRRAMRVAWACSYKVRLSGAGPQPRFASRRRGCRYAPLSPACPSGNCQLSHSPRFPSAVICLLQVLDVVEDGSSVSARLLMVMGLLRRQPLLSRFQGLLASSVTLAPLPCRREGRLDDSWQRYLLDLSAASLPSRSSLSHSASPEIWSEGPW